MVPEGRGSTLFIPCRGFDDDDWRGPKSRKGIVSRAARPEGREGVADRDRASVTAPAGPVSTSSR
jgi:hypothetical protein